MKNIKHCIVCGRPFYAPPSSEKVCCSKACSHILREQRVKSGIYDKSICAANHTALSSPELQRGETNINAKAWQIQAPDGTIYECYNLLDWLREHKDQLDGTPMQAWNGISKIKYSMQGKRKRPSKSWKGWKLLAWGENRGQHEIKK